MVIMKIRHFDLADDKLAVGGFAEDDDFTVEVGGSLGTVGAYDKELLALADDGSAVEDFAEYDVLTVEVVEMRPW